MTESSGMMCVVGLVRVKLNRVNRHGHKTTRVQEHSTAEELVKLDYGTRLFKEISSLRYQVRYSLQKKVVMTANLSANLLIAININDFLLCLDVVYDSA